MKKILSAAILASNLLANSNVYAAAVVVDPTNLVQTTLAAVKTGLTAASTAVIEAKTSIMEAFDKSAWGKQTAQMVDTIKGIQDTIAKVNEAKNKLTSEITGLRTGVTGFVNEVSNPADPSKDVNYRYAEKLPESYLPAITCSNLSTGCTVVGTGYKGVATPKNSADLRNDLRVDPTKVGYDPLFGTTKTIMRIANEAAEQNAQEVAVIQAMAREAYTEANNRIERIEALRKLLLPPSEGGTAPTDETNDLKYTADIQAQIQVQQALLVNEQNKLAALTVLQQSQRDMYLQRKKEIAAYTKSGDRDASAVQSTERAVILLGKTAAFAALNAIYQFE
jgi:hypothetical protein